MKTTHRLAALVASTVLVAGLSQTVLATTAPAATTKAPATTTAASKQKAAKSISWASLNAWQKSVLSRLEQVWPTIPADKQKGFIASADNWKKTSAEDQQKIIADMDSYLTVKK